MKNWFIQEIFLLFLSIFVLFKVEKIIKENYKFYNMI